MHIFTKKIRLYIYIYSQMLKNISNLRSNVKSRKNKEREVIKVLRKKSSDWKQNTRIQTCIYVNNN